MGWKPIFSMPHGTNVFFPLILIVISLLLSFRTLSSCDLITTKWSIDCSSQYNSQCVFKSNISLGLLAKETYIDLTDDDDIEENIENLTKVCRWYTDDEREWLLGMMWDFSVLSQSIIVVVALFGMIFIGATTCYDFKAAKKCKALSIIFCICSLINGIPLVLKFNSDVCTIDEGICDPTNTFCVTSCSWGAGSWQALAASCLWLASSISLWVLSPAKRIHKHEIQSDDSSLETRNSGDGGDEESNK